MLFRRANPHPHAAKHPARRQSVPSMTWHGGPGRPHHRSLRFLSPSNRESVKNCHAHARTRTGRLVSPLPHCTVCVRRAGPRTGSPPPPAAQGLARSALVPTEASSGARRGARTDGRSAWRRIRAHFDTSTPRGLSICRTAALSPYTALPLI